MAAHDAEFQQAKGRLGSLKNDPGNQVKLQMYGYFKQATIGQCNVKKPGMMDFVGKAKWEAWNSLGSMTPDDAQMHYVQLVDTLAKAEAPSGDSASPDSAATQGKFKELLYTEEDGITKIVLNRPGKKNAINVQMYEEWIQALNDAAKNDSTLAVVTGAGDYYCSGNDLSNFMNIPPGGMSAMAIDGGELLQRFVAAFIDFPKPLIGVINGPAVGVSVTTLGLFDVIYATSKATFNTPFSALGQSPEGCSSYVFPKIMGQAKANEMLLFNRKLTSHEACERGLVTEVFPDDVFQKEVWARIKALAKLPKNSLRESKCLIRNAERETLHRVNRQECELLVKLWQGDECIAAIMGFFSNKAKL